MADNIVASALPVTGDYTQQVSLQFKATTPDQLPEIVSFLSGVFGASPDSPNLARNLLAWKYYDVGPEWSGSRSYALRKGDLLAAHTGIWPIRLATRSGTVQALQAVDWAGARDVPGAGASLMNRLRKLAPVLITVGGSPDTRRALPAMGFKTCGAMEVYARVLRPWLQFRTRPFDGPRAFPRLLRNALWSRSPVAQSHGWTCQPSVHPDSDMLARFGEQSRDYPESRHSTGFIEYLLKCPAAKVSYFELSNLGQKSGYFVLSRAGGQIRLADLRILSEKTTDWVAAYAVAVDAASRDPKGCEVIARASTSVSRQALEANGFRARGNLPVFVLDPGKALGEFDSIALGMLDDDSLYLNDPASPYCT